MVKKIIFSIILFLVFLEILLRFSGKYLTNNEKASGWYVFKYKIVNSGWLHTWKPNLVLDYKQAEFGYTNFYNELGHREQPFSNFLKDTSSIKIIAIGDSFTEGDGTCYDSTWVKKLSFLVDNNTSKKFNFYNAGVCGSDVFFNYQMLRLKLVKSKPKLVIECLNTSDIDDVIWKGGQERFNSDSTSSVKIGPKWEKVYKNSHLFRAIIHRFLGYNENLIKINSIKEKELNAIDLIDNQVKQTAYYCKQNNINYLLLLQPCPAEIGMVNDERQKLFLNKLSELPFAINLFKPLNQFYATQSIKNFSWPINGHYNSSGYWVLGNTIFNEIGKKDSTLFK